MMGEETKELRSNLSPQENTPPLDRDGVQSRNNNSIAERIHKSGVEEPPSSVDSPDRSDKEEIARVKNANKLLLQDLMDSQTEILSLREALADVSLENEDDSTAIIEVHTRKSSPVSLELGTIQEEKSHTEEKIENAAEEESLILAAELKKERDDDKLALEAALNSLRSKEAEFKAA